MRTQEQVKKAIISNKRRLHRIIRNLCTDILEDELAAEDYSALIVSAELIREAANELERLEEV